MTGFLPRPRSVPRAHTGICIRRIYNAHPVARVLWNRKYCEADASRLDSLRSLVRRILPSITLNRWYLLGKPLFSFYSARTPNARIRTSCCCLETNRAAKRIARDVVCVCLYVNAKGIQKVYISEQRKHADREIYFRRARGLALVRVCFLIP